MTKYGVDGEPLFSWELFGGDELGEAEARHATLEHEADPEVAKQRSVKKRQKNLRYRRSVDVDAEGVEGQTPVEDKEETKDVLYNFRYDHNHDGRLRSLENDNLKETNGVNVINKAISSDPPTSVKHASQCSSCLQLGHTSAQCPLKHDP